MATTDVRDLFKGNNQKKKTSGITDVRDLFWTEESANEFYGSFQDRLTNWTNAQQSLISSTNDFYNNRDLSSYGLDGSNRWKETVSNRVNWLQQEADSIADILKEYGRYFDTETVNKIALTFRDSKNMSSNILKQADADIEFWNQFKGEEDYQNYYFNNKYDGKSYEEVLKALESSSGKEKDWLSKNSQYYMSSQQAQGEIDSLNKELEKLNIRQRQGTMTGSNPLDYSDYKALTGQIESTENRIAELTEIKGQATLKENKKVFEAEAKGDKDFGNYVTLGESNGLSIENKWFQADSNGFNIFDRGYADDIVAARNGKTVESGSDAYWYAQHMTDDQYKNYVYFLGKYGKDKASEYLDTIKYELNTKQALEIQKSLDGTVVLPQLFGLYAGINSFGEDLKGLFSNGYEAPSATQIASGLVREDQGAVGKVFYDIANTTGRQLPTILGTAVATTFLGPTGGQIVGAGLTGASSMGGARQEMLNLGYSNAQATTYGFLTGASEAGLQYVLGGIGKVGGAWTDDAVKNFTKGLNSAGAKFAIEFGADMVSEGIEEGLQEVLDPFFKKVATGKNEGVDWGQVAYSGFLGALSAGILNGFGASVNRAGEVSLANDIKKQGKVNTIKELGNTFAADTLANKLASKVNDKTGAWKIADVIHEMRGTLSEQNKADIKYQLVRSGMVESDAETVAEWLGKAVDGEHFTALQKKALDNNPIISRVFKKVIIDQNSTVNQRLQAMMDVQGIEGHAGVDYSAIAKAQSKEGLTASANLQQTLKPMQTDAIKQKYGIGRTALGDTDATLDSMVSDAKKAMSNAKVSESGVTTDSSTGKQINIKRVVDTNGKVATYAMADGSTVRSTNVEYANDDEGMLYEGAISLGYSADVTNGIIHGYQAVNMPVAKYLNGIDEAIEYGRIGYPMDKISNDGFYADLPDSMKKYAYDLGKESAKKDTDIAQADVDGFKGKADTAKEGKVVIRSKAALTERQKTSINTVGKAVSDITHNKVVFFDTVKKGNTLVFAEDVGGHKKGTKAPNGFYDKATGTIYIDINAGQNGEGVILWTAAHELTHFIRQWSPAKFKVLADFLMAEYGKKGVDIQALIDNKTAEARANKKTITRDKAYEEVVADSMQTMFTDTNLAEKLERLKNKDKGLWEKIKAFFRDLYKKIKEAYKGLDAQTEEARLVREMGKTIERLSNLFAEAIVDAGETFASAEQQALADVGIGFDAETQSVAPVLFSERTWTASEYVQNKEAAIKAIAKQLGVSESKARQYVDDINSIARLIADDRARLDYEPNMDDGATVLKPNSEYKYTVDMSTLCAKRLLFTGTFDAIQKALPNTVFDSDDIVRLRKMMQDRHLEVACGICYVESTRREIGRITQEFIDRYKVAQKTGKPITRVNSSGKEVALSVKGKTFMADPNYTPNLGELNTTDIDIVKRDHREVYDAYLAFMNARGQAKPKLLETRAEYKGEILKHFKAKSAVNSRNAHGGLRLQSFSDFEVPHMIDMMQVVMDMSRVGLKSQAYTKVPAFADVFGGTGVKINLSLIAKGSGLDANGNLVFDDIEGINHEEAFRLREKYSRNVGTILVGKSDAHIIAAMADPRIDFIIPFHKSSWKESLYDALGLTGYDDYTESQNEKPIDKERKIDNFDPSEYWDFSKSGDENAQIYLQKCREDGRIPKFSQFQSYPGYWKLLIDFKMYDNNGVGVPQEVVQPNFDMDSANRILSEYKGDHKSYPVAKDVVEDFVKEYGNLHEVADETEATTADNMMFSERAEYKQEVEQWAKEGMHDGETFVLGSTGDVLQGLGAIENDIYLHGDKIKTILSEHQEMTIDEIKKIPQILDDPILILKSRNVGREGKDNTRLVIFGSVKAKNGQPVLSVLDIRPIEGKLVIDDMQKVVSAYTKDTDPTTYIKNSDVMYADKKRATSLLRSIGFQMPIELNKSGFVGSISYVGRNVKMGGEKFSDVFIETDEFSYSERTSNATDNRTLLANALESVAQNDVEREWLKKYKSQIASLNADQEKLAELRAKIKDAMFTEGGDRKQLPALKNKADIIAERINRADKKLLNLEASKPLQKVIDRERAKAYKLGMEKLSAYRKERAESKELHYYRPRIEKIVSDLQDRLEHPSAKTAIPEVFGATIAKVLSAFNFTTYDNEGNPRKGKANATRAEARESLKALAEQLGQNTIESTYGQFDVPPEMVEWIEKIHGYFEATAEHQSEEYNINKMTGEELKLVYKFLKAWQKAINNVGRYYSNASYDVMSDARSTMDYVGELPKEINETAQKASKTLKWDFASPVTVFDRFGEGGKHVYQMLVKGQSKMAYNVQEVLDFVEKAYTEKEAKLWREELVKVQVGGTEYEVTVEMLMGLHCLLRQEDSRRHILEGGGIRFADVKHKGKVKRFENIFFNEVDAMAVEKALDNYPRAKEVAESMQQFMEKVGSSWGNEISMIRFGYHAFTTPGYYPIRTVAAGSEYEAQQKRANIYALLNKSFTKERNLKANNAVIVDGIFSVFNNHMAEMALYNAWALPVIDTIKWFNYKETQDIDAKVAEKSVHETFRLAYGTYADEYVRRLLESINSQTDGGLSEELAFRNLRMVNRVAVSWNVRVAIQQPFSVARAFELINPKYVTPLVGKEYTKANEEMLANSGIAKWKSMGYYDVDVSRPLETQVMKNASVADKFSEKGMKLAELADSATWASLWNACKKETAEKNKGLDSKALLEKTAERFNDIILRTQVVDSVLTKSQWMRSNSFWHRMTSAFMSEPLTSYNALLRQADKYARDVATKGAKFATKNNIKGIAKATTVFVFTQLLNALVTAPLDALRDDDDYETYLEKVLANFKENAVGNLMPWNMLPYVSDIMDYLLYGRTDRSDMAYAVNVIDLAKSIYNLADNYSYHKLHNTFNKALSVASQTSGFAVSNIWRDAVSVWNAVAGSLGYGELKFQTGADSKTAGYKKMYEAMLDGDDDRAGYLFGQMLSNGVEVDDIYSGLTKQVGEDVKSGKITDEEATERLKAIIDITGKVDSEGNAPTDNDVYWMIDKWHYAEENGNTEGYSKYDDIFTAMESGDPTTAIAEHLERSTAAYFAEAKAKAEKEGETFNEKKAMKEAESKAESAIKSAVTSHWKPLYKEAYKNKDDEEMKRIRYMLRDTKLYGSTSDLLNTLKGWIQS